MKKIIIVLALFVTGCVNAGNEFKVKSLESYDSRLTYYWIIPLKGQDGIEVLDSVGRFKVGDTLILIKK